MANVTASTDDAIATAIPEGFAPLGLGPGFARRCGDFYLHAVHPILAVRISADHLNSLGIAHGGLLATLVDTAMGAIFRRTFGGAPPPTINLSIDYLGAVRAGDWLETHVELHKAGKRIANASCRVTVGERLVVRASGIFIMGPGAASPPSKARVRIDSPAE